jgi:hypothetical protein
VPGRRSPLGCQPGDRFWDHSFGHRDIDPSRARNIDFLSDLQSNNRVVCV